MSGELAYLRINDTETTQVSIGEGAPKTLETAAEGSRI